ncbi:MAG: MFS transporter [Xanthomonadales bacterium]|nr:MFS transporter [Xanthomonadales bacterium]
MSSLDLVARPTPLDRLLAAAGARPGEGAALGWAFLYFFALLCGYYTIRPVRDAMGALHALEWLFTATFVVMLLLQPIYGALVGRYPRRVFLPVVYGFFALCLVGFWLLLAAEGGAGWRSGAFFVWVAVFNLFAVSVFWSFMSDIFDDDQARRLYGAIAAGGTLGALVGPLLTQWLVTRIGVPSLLLVAAALIGVCLLAISRLIPWARARERRGGLPDRDREAIGGGILEGAWRIGRSRFLLALALLMFLGVAVGTLLYNEMAAYTRRAFPDAADRTAWYARIDFAINVITVSVQLLLTRRLLTRLGAGPLLVLPTSALCLALLALALVPGVALLLALAQIVARSGNFALLQPARESLFTRVDRIVRYKTKNFIDTVVYRGGDLSFAWLHKGLTLAGAGAAGIAWVALGCGLALTATALWASRLARAEPAPRTPP